VSCIRNSGMDGNGWPMFSLLSGCSGSDSAVGITYDSLSMTEVQTDVACLYCGSDQAFSRLKWGGCGDSWMGDLGCDCLFND
jgi:hypothetical protein